MSIEFQRWTFLEFFDEENMLEAEGQIIVYNVNTMINSLLSLYMEPYEQSIVITLMEKDTKHIIFEVSIKNITKITCNETTLFFYKEKKQSNYSTCFEPDYTIVVKPKVSLSLHLT